MLADAFLRSGKVRDLYELPGEQLLLVASDRISAFDVVLPTPIPDKGRVLTGLSRHWFATTADIVPNHLVSADPTGLPADVLRAVEERAGLHADDTTAAWLRGRSMICRRADVLPVECIVRGYVSGSGWKDYVATGGISGIALPPGLRESERLPEPIFTPSTKAEQGTHDENIDFDEARRLLGGSLAEQIRDTAIRLYTAAATRTESVGIILADTKFEFGIDPETDELLLIDEVLTPDSSRFWDAASYHAGGPQPSFDKQFVRDWLETQPWDKTAPGPSLPPDVIAGTHDRYVQAFERITGARFDRYLAEDVIA